MGVAQHDLLPFDWGQGPGLEVLTRPPTDMLEFRRKFVIEMGWFDETHTDDRDRYDDALSTIHLMERDTSGKILSGMRLTRLGSLEESLSIEMLRGNSEMQDIAKKFGQSIDYSKTDLWDLTRLVHRFGHEPGFGESIESTQAIFGAGLAKTMPEDGRDVVWAFTTTQLVVDFLDGSGIKTEPIAHGKLSAGDEQNSHFRIIRPVSSMQFLRDNRDKDDTYDRTFKAVDRGFRALAES